MDKETVAYIKNYFRDLMTNDEKLALTYHMYSNNTFEEFELSIVKRIMKDTPEKVFFNNCPECNKLARTPIAQQCRYCGHSWRNKIVGQFQLDYAIQITGRSFFLMGQIVNGEIKQGQVMDLRGLGINKKVEIKSIESALTRRNGEACEDIGLGTDELAEEDKEHLKNISSFKMLFDIISKS